MKVKAVVMSLLAGAILSTGLAIGAQPVASSVPLKSVQMVDENAGQIASGDTNRERSWRRFRHERRERHWRTFRHERRERHWRTFRHQRNERHWRTFRHHRHERHWRA